MKDIRQGECPLCDHPEVIEAVPSVSGRYGDAYHLALSEGRRTDGKTWEDTRVEIGPLTSFTCRACGFTQWFAQNPQSIPIGDGFHTRIVEGPKRGPYR